MRCGWTLLVVAAAAAGCGGSHGGRDAAVEHPASGPDASDAADRGGARLWPACGGTVQVTGTTPSGPFTAQYVLASYTPCGGVLLVDIAQSDALDSGVIQIELVRHPETNSFVGPSTVTATYIPPGMADARSSLETAVDISEFPPTIDMDQDGGRDPVAGTISIDANGVSLSGNFSSRLCSVAACG